MRYLLAGVVLAAITSTGSGVEPMQRQLASQFTQRGIERLEAGDFGEGLAFLSHALRLDPAHRSAHWRLHSYLTQRSYALPIREWALPEDLPFTIFHPDHDRLIAHDGKGRAQLFETLTGRAVSKPFQTDLVWEERFALEPAAFSPDGKWIITHTGNGIVLRDGRTGEPASPPMKTRCAVARIKLDAGSEVLFVEGSVPGELGGIPSHEVWDLRTFKRITLPLPESAHIAKVEHAPGAKELAVAALDTAARTWLALRWSWHDNALVLGPVALCGMGEVRGFSTDFSKVTGRPSSEASPQGGAWAWAMSDGEPVQFDSENFPFFGGDIGFGVSGPPFPAQSGAIAHLMKTAEESLKLPCWPQVSSEARLLARGEESSFKAVLPSITGDSRAWLWSTWNGVPLIPALRHPMNVHKMVFLVDSRHVVAVCGDDNSYSWRAKKLRGWQLRGGPGGTTARIDGHPFVTLRVLPDGTVATISVEGVLKKFDGRTLAPVGSPLNVPVNGYDWTPDGRWLVSLKEDEGMPAEVQRWDVSRGETAGKRIALGEGTHQISVSGDGRLLAVTADGEKSPRVFDIETGEQLAKPFPLKDDKGEQLYYRDPKLSPDGRLLAVNDASSDYAIWDWRAGKKIAEGFGVSINPPARVFSPDNRNFALLADEWSHRGIPSSHAIWDIDASGRLDGSPIAWRWGEGNAVAFSNDGSLLAAGDGESAVSVLRCRDHRMLYAALPLASRVAAVTFNADGTLLATGCSHGVRVWDVTTGMPITEYLRADHGILEVRFSPDSTRVIALDEGHTLWAWQLAPDAAGPVGKLCDLAEAVAGLRVNPETGRPEFSDPLPVTQRLRAENPNWWFFQDVISRTVTPDSTSSTMAFLEIDDGNGWFPRASRHPFNPLARVLNAAERAGGSSADEESKNIITIATAAASGTSDENFRLAMAFLKHAVESLHRIDAEALRAARRFAQHAVETDPKVPRYKAQLAEIDWLLGNLAAAEAAWAKAIEQEPGNAVWLARRAESLAALNRHAEAKPLIEHALGLRPFDAEIRTAYGWVLLHAGKFAGARDQFYWEPQENSPEETRRDPSSNAGWLDRSFGQFLSCLMTDTVRPSEVFYPLPDSRTTAINARHPLTPAQRERIEKALRKLIATGDEGAKRFEEARRALEKAPQ